MVNLAAHTLVAGAPRLPVPYGLFSQAPPKENPGERWESGVVVETLGCNRDVGGLAEPGCPPTTGTHKTFVKGQGSYEASPFTIYGYFLCSPVGYGDGQAQLRAEQHLLAREEQRVEKAFWTGDLSSKQNLSTITDTAPSAAAQTAGVGLGSLEAELADKYGSLGVIHMTRAAALLLIAAELLVVKAGKIFTQTGTPVIAGSGYTGDGPAGVKPAAGNTWAYITAPLIAYRSEIFTSSNRDGDLFDKQKNDLFTIAERNYLVGYDPCGAAAALLKLP
jgi:hypothetical protein